MRLVGLVGLVVCLGVTLVAPGLAPASESMRTVSLTASEFRFAPAAIAVRRGERVALRITNRGTMNHEFLSTIFKAADDVEVKLEGAKVEADEVEEVEFEKGHTVVIELTPTRVGTFQFWCGEKYKGKLHRDLGMKGTITVRP